jgi:hypothetical protein
LTQKLTKKQAKKLISDADAKIRKVFFAKFGNQPTVLGYQINRNYLKDLDTVTKILQKYYDGIDRV